LCMWRTWKLKEIWHWNSHKNNAHHCRARNLTDMNIPQTNLVTATTLVEAEQSIEEVSFLWL
jgi:hypothetical protein